MSTEEMIKKKFEESRGRLKAKHEGLVEEFKKKFETIRNKTYEKFQEIGI